MWENYVFIFGLLTRWMTPLVGKHEAETVARRALAYMARLSWNGYQTQEGPWAELVGMCCSDMASHGLLGRQENLVAVPGPRVTPDEQGMVILCALYAASYQGSWVGQWSVGEREQVYQCLRINNPRELPKDQDSMIEAVPLSIRTLIRRALSDSENLLNEGTMAGQVAASIADDEVIKSLFWLRQFGD